MGRRLVLPAGMAAALFMAGVVVPAAGADEALVVETTSGAVAGVLDGSAMEWRGIPYAAPPVGDLRWRPPVPVEPWTDVRDATEFASPCLQPDFFAGTAGSEDCLYLNVFAPASVTADSDLAVMVHLHPGGNGVGRAYEDATAFTDRGVIVVTVDYRLGVLGFVGHPALSAEGGGSSGEYGLLDQIQALHWVQDNIAAFGGDPSRVTLFGMSAGSFDTVAIMASPLSEGLIHGAAVQGDVHWGVTGLFNGIDEAEEFGLELTAGLGCDSAPSELDCLRAADGATIVEAAGFVDIVPWVGGAVLPRSPLELVTERETVPLLVGFDREEESVWFFDFQAGTFPPYTKRDWMRDTNQMLGWPSGADVRRLYPPEEYDSLFWSFITAQTDVVRGCPTRRLAHAVQAPVWRYLYANVYEGDPLGAQVRASHALEDLILWDLDRGMILTPADVALGDRMTDYWTNFAKTADPNGPGLPQWPLYDTATEPSLVLDDQITVVNRYHSEQCALIDAAPIPFPWPFELSGHGPSYPPPGFFHNSFS